MFPDYPLMVRDRGGGTKPRTGIETLNTCQLAGPVPARASSTLELHLLY